MAGTVRTNVMRGAAVMDKAAMSTAVQPDSRRPITDNPKHDTAL